MSWLARVCARGRALYSSYVCLYALCIQYAQYVGFAFKELTLIRINFDNFRQNKNKKLRFSRTFSVRLTNRLFMIARRFLLPPLLLLLLFLVNFVCCPFVVDIVVSLNIQEQQNWKLFPGNQRTHIHTFQQMGGFICVQNSIFSLAHGQGTLYAAIEI